MKNIVFILIILALISKINYAHGNEPELFNTEITVFNFTSDTLEVLLHPVSALFNGNNYYSLIAKTMIISQNNNSYNYNNGTHYKQPDILERKNILPPNITSYPGWNSDELAGNPSSFGSFGYGVYKIIFKNLRTERIDSCLMEFDYGGLQQSDLFFYLYDDTTTTNYRFSYKFSWTGVIPQNVNVPINYDSLRAYLAIPWEPNSFINNNHTREKNFGPSGGFILKNFDTLSLKYNSDYFPLDSRIHCDYLNQNQNFFLIQNHAFPYPYEEPQTGYYDERHGVLTLNLTIKKRVISPPYRSIFSVNNPNPTKIIVSPGVTLSVLRNEPTDNPNQDYMYNGIVLGKYYNSNAGNELIIKSQDDKYPAGKIFLGHSDDIDSNNRVVINSYASLKAESGSILELGENSEIDVEISSNDSLHRGKLILQNGSNLITHNQSKIIVKYVGVFENYGANISNSSNFHLNISDGGKYHVIADNYIHTINNGAYIKVTNGTIEIANNSKLIFDGIQSYLSITGNSNIILGQNASIEFKNGAKLIAGGSQISSVNGSLPGRGFVFENAGEGTTITNCVFNNLSNPIYILNTTYASSNINYNISYNTFNCNDKLNYAIESKNSNVIDIGFNNVLMQTGKGLGILLKYTGDLTGGEYASPSYNIQIRNNQIANGVISTAVLNLTSAYPVINYRFNNFYGSATNSNVVVNHISGDIKNNSFSSNSSACVSLNLNHAIPNIFSNSFTSYAKNIYNSYSYPKIGPNPENSSDGGWIWLGGKNNIQSLYDGNLYFGGGNALLDWGQNCFYKATGSYHLWGNIDEDSLLYYVRNNDFNNSNIPISKLFDIGSGYPVNTHSSGSSFGCNNSTDAGTIWLIRDLGNGITDTIYRTNNTSGYQPPADEVLYSTAINKKLIDNNFDAVSYFKSLINSYPSSSYTEACLYDLYDCYLKLDTSGNQTVKDILFTDLKNYLDSKILSGNYSDEFSDIAYQIGVMCLTVIAEYDDAMSGYEFIALYHPDAYTRLLASWEYSEIEELLNGSGGLSSRDDNLTDEEYFVKLSKKVNKTLTGDPVKGKLKKTYEKSKTEKAERQKAEIKSNFKDENLTKNEIQREIQKINQKEQASKMKVVSVLRNSKSMTREEKDKRQIEDIVIGSRTEDEKQKVENMNITPEKYDLGQNYPNPFNPVTNIQFQVPSLKFVNLVVYDILGRQVKTLVNEIKSPGKYIVSFDAYSLSSGVYFYKMTSGEFSDVKRMVLVK